MTAFTFTAPVGLWALAALAAVVVFYLFYRRYRPRRVTGLFLWGVPQRGNLGGRKAETPLLSRAFLFDLLAALFLALSLAGPAWRGAGGLPLAIVLDSSFAMQARDRHHDIQRDAAALAKRTAGPTRGAFVVLAGETPALLYGPGPAAGAASAIAGYDPTASSSDLQAAVDLVRDAYGLGLDIHVFTNREATLLAGADSLLTTHVYAAQGDNLAFRQVWREPGADAGNEIVTVALVNHADSATRAELRLEAAADGELITLSEVALQPSGKAVTRYGISGVADKTLKISMSAEGRDVIAADSVAFLPAAPQKKVTYGLMELPPAAARFVWVALEAAGATPWVAADPRRDNDGPDLLITADSESAGRVATLEIPGTGQPVVHQPPLIMDAANRLCRDVRLGDLPWVSGGAADAASARNIAEVVIASGNRPLYWRSADGRLYLDAALDSSPLVFSTAWPVLIANLVSEVAAALPGLAESVYNPGQPLAYRPDPFAPDRPSYRLVSRDPAGSAIPVDPAGGGVTPRRAGWYDLQAGDQPVAEIAVLPLYGDASDVRHAADRDIIIAPANDAVAAAGLIDLRWLFVLIGLCFLALNWRRTITGDQ